MAVSKFWSNTFGEQIPRRGRGLGAIRSLLTLKKKQELSIFNQIEMFKSKMFLWHFEQNETILDKMTISKVKNSHRERMHLGKKARGWGSSLSSNRIRFFKREIEHSIYSHMSLLQSLYRHLFHNSFICPLFVICNRTTGFWGLYQHKRHCDIIFRINWI
jgi:hypothetical protein